MPDLTIGTMRPHQRARWDAFVLQCPDATFFHRAAWQSVIERAFHHPTWFLYAERNGEICGVLPLAQVRSRLFGHTLCSLPFCVYGGIAALDEEAVHALDQAAQELAARLRVDHLEYRHVRARHPDWPRKSLYYTFRQSLHPSPEHNLAAIPRKQRAMVRKGMAAGLSSVMDEDSDRFYAAYANSVRNLGSPVFHRNYFRILREEFGADCDILTVQRGGKAVCSVLSFHFRGEVLPYYGGGGEQARYLAANDFMYWEVMRRACERGESSFDFGRSKLGTGAYAFKKNWGFKPQALHYECQLHHASEVAEVNPLNPRYQLFIRAWRHLPLRIANLCGPFLVRYLG